jgi:hypothetical protein
MMRGSAAIMSSGPISVGMVRTPSSRAVSWAMSTSEYESVAGPGVNPTVKVRICGLNSRAKATTAVESTPLDRNAPTGTSERMCTRTLSRSVSRIRL